MNQPRTEIYLPCSSDDVRRWAANVEVESPIGKVGEDYVQFECTAQLHAGVEITFSLDGLPLHTLAVFGSPNSEERAIEEGRGDPLLDHLISAAERGSWDDHAFLAGELNG
jgi:hypothetical protein